MTECLKMFEKSVLWKPPVAASEIGFEEFLRISKSGLTWNNLFDLTNLNVKIAKSWQLCALKCG